MDNQYQVEWVPVETLKPHPKNPRDNKKAIKPVAESIAQYGFLIPIVADRDNTIRAGHTRHKAAQLLGMATVPVIYADHLTEDQLNRFMLVDNKTAEIATWDKEQLQDFVTTVLFGNLEGLIGFTQKDLQQIAADIAPVVEPEYPIVPKLNEKYDYVVIMTDSITDWNYLKSLVGVRGERSYKNKTVGEGRVITFKRFMENLRANRNQFDGSLENNPDAPDR